MLQLVQLVKIMRGFRGISFIPLVCLVWMLTSTPVLAQFKTREEQIEQQRREKRARLWLERQSPIAKRLNGLVANGLLDGLESHKGTNGPQFVLGGMRAGNGTTFGLGYRRSDIWHDRIGVRSTIRGTSKKALLIDFELDLPRLTSERGEIDFYAKYENSPQIDYYGQGEDSAKSKRSSFRLEDTAFDLRGAYRVFSKLRVRGHAGGLLVHTGRGKRKGFPSIEDIFDPTNTPGLGEKTDFLLWGGGFQFDYRDNPNGPRSGGNYYLDFTRYVDRGIRKHSFRQLDSAVEQYIPYFNKTRVIVLRLGAVMAFKDTTGGQTVPFYLQPVLGGNRFLRGFSWYRFRDNSMIVGTVEHRWHVFSGMDAALFFEAGKVAPRIRDLNFNGLEYSGGWGFRFKVRESVVMRIDMAASREGFRFMWTFGNVF